MNLEGYKGIIFPYILKEDRFKNHYLVFLDSHVLVVATVNTKMEGEDVVEWSAYIGAVMDEDGWERVAKHGSKLPKKIAELLFPFSETHRWRG